MGDCAACGAISDGSGHVYYGLAIAWVILFMAAFSGKLATWLLLIASAIIAGVAVDLFAHGYTH